jgi:hypothetical protein
MSVIPLGAGDLVDRAVRFYRKHFLTYILIASPPVVAGTLITVGWTLLGRQIFSIGAEKYSTEYIFYYAFLWLGVGLIWLIETIATLVVMGGASRNFVRHLLFDEAISFRETYRNTGKRLFGLIFAATLITIVLAAIAMVISYVGLIVAALIIGLIVSVLSTIPIAAFILSLIVVLITATAAVWLFFLIASRLAYVPQIMLVEGKGVFQAIGRSAGFSTGSVRRLAALFIFTTAATYSALALLYVPLLWYAEANGVRMMNSDLVPAWYEIASNLISQISFILLSPVWMIGLCLLYVDERVRSEGYDIELMAAARLGEIPAVPATYVNPLEPALSANAFAGTPRGEDKTAFSTLGLK